MEKKENTNPWLALLLLWGVVVFFTLYGAATVRDELKHAWLEESLERVAKVRDGIGLSHVRDGVEAIRGRLNHEYVVLASEAVVAEPPPIAGTPPDPKEGSHRVAPAKHRVLVVGASSIQFALGVELEHILPVAYQGVKTKRFGKLATGLSRPDFFDWPKKIDQLAKQFKPDLMIANYGGNCAQDIPIGAEMVQYEDEEKWDRVYSERVEELVEIAKKHGSDFVFIGMPNMRDPKFSKKMERLNRVQKRAAEKAGALWISVWEMTSTENGAYKTEISFRKERGLMRAIDGVHYRTLGARYIVDQTMQEVERHFLLSPADASLARSERHTFESKQLAKGITYLAYVPSSASDQNRLPVLYLVPGEQSKWSEWPNHPHRQLQRLATEHHVVLVVLEFDELQPQLLAEEIAPDVERHLPVSDRRGLVGPNLLEMHVALERLEVAHTFKEVDRETFNRSLLELVSWHAEQLRTPVTRR